MNLEALRVQEDECLRLVESWPKSKQLTIFMLLKRGHKCSMDNIDHERIKEWKKEMEGSHERKI